MEVRNLRRGDGDWRPAHDVRIIRKTMKIIRHASAAVVQVIEHRVDKKQMLVYAWSRLRELLLLLPERIPLPNPTTFDVSVSVRQV